MFGNDEPETDYLDLQKLTTIRTFIQLREALLAKGLLDSNGIECYLVDDNMVRLDWFLVNVLGGIKLKVRAEDEESALQLLNRPFIEPWGEYE